MGGQKRTTGGNISRGCGPGFALSAKARGGGRKRLFREAEKFDLKYRKLHLEHAMAKQLNLITAFSSDSGRNARVRLMFPSNSTVKKKRVTETRPRYLITNETLMTCQANL